MTAEVEGDPGGRGTQRDAEDGHGAAFDEAGPRVNGRSLSERRNDRLGPRDDSLGGLALALAADGRQVDDVRSVRGQVLELDGGGRGLNCDQGVLGRVGGDAVVEPEGEVNQFWLYKLARHKLD